MRLSMIVLMLLGACSTYSQTRAKLEPAYDWVQAKKDAALLQAMTNLADDIRVKNGEIPTDPSRYTSSQGANNKMNVQADMSSTYKAVERMNRPVQTQQVLQIQPAPFSRPSDRIYQVTTFRQ